MIFGILKKKNPGLSRRRGNPAQFLGAVETKLCNNKEVTNLECGEHDTELSVLQVRFHQIINEMDLSGKVLDTGPDDDELEQWKQVIHTPLILTAKVPLYHLFIPAIYIFVFVHYE